MKITIEEIRRLVEILPGSAIVYQLKNGIHRLAYSDDLPRLAGYTPEEYRLCTAADAGNAIEADDRAEILRRMQQAAATGAETEIDCRLRRRDGSRLRVNMRVRCIGTMEETPVLLSILTNSTLEEQQIDMINRVPVGMGIYEVTDGVPSLLYLNDSYYHMMGFERVERTSYLGVNTIKAVYPDDRHIVTEGLQSIVAGKVHHCRMVVRMLTHSTSEYHWIQMEGRIAKQSGRTTTLYVSFTKIDGLKQAEQSLSAAKAELEKSHAWLQAAMDSAGIQYFEYYPAEHKVIGYSGGNIYGLPHVVENYPECLFRDHMVYPEDEESYRALFDKLNAGESPVRWEGRGLVGAEFRWFRVIMTRANDGGAQPVISCTMTDITLEKEATAAYRGHLDSVLRASPDAIASFRWNVTRNVCVDGVSSYERIAQLKNSGTVDGFVTDALRVIPDENSREEFYSTFSRQALQQAFEAGKSSVAVEHRLTLEPEHTEWTTTKMDLMRNPATGDLEGVLYALNTNMHRVEQVILENILQKAYDLIAVVDVQTDEYFLFERLTKTHGKHFAHFTANHDAGAQRYMSAEEWQQLAPKLCIATVQAMLEKQGGYSVNHFTKTPNGMRRRQANYFFADREHKTLIASLRDFSDEDLLEQFRFASEHDPVTSLYNRHKTFDECRRMLEEHPNESFYICHMDIQRFHLINTFYGEAEGDALLSGIGRMFARFSRDFPYAVYGRIEADVFCICIPVMRAVLERDTRLMKQWLREYRSDFPVEANFGAYEIKDKSLRIEAMFARATMAAKNMHDSLVFHYSIFDDAMEAELQKEQQISNDMLTALEQEQFKVYLQPKYLLRDSTPCGAEALVRWMHPVKGMISPGDFIPLFEKNGFILRLDRYMWEKVCILLRRWLDEGKNPSPVSVNVSRVSMYSPTTVPFLHDLVEKYRLPHDLMQLELTESAYMDDPSEMKRRLQALQADGFTILMDDFGSGYSSLNTLRELPVDYLKIDMLFLSAKGDAQRSRLILASVIRMACWLNLPVITEGVETPEQKEFLDGLGCAYAQGYLFARPMPVEKYEQDVLAGQSAAAELPTEQLSTVVSLITDSSEVTRFLSEKIPMPMAFVDVSEQEFAYMRANRKFQEAFGFGSDIIEKQLLLQKHLTAEEYQVLMNAYRSAATRQEQAECIFYWQADEGGRRCYLMRAQYLGRSAYSAVLLATFLDVTAYSRLSQPAPQQLQAFRNRYTEPAVAQMLRLFDNIFDLARVVLPEQNRVMTVDAGWQAQTMPERCYACWSKTEKCDNCISAQALRQQRTMLKVERRGMEQFFVFAYPIELVTKDGMKKAVVELVTKPNELALAAVQGSADDGTATEYYKTLSYRDTLTATWNRRYFNDMLYLPQDEYFKTNPSLGFILLDLCNFKAINETLGHEIADGILVEAANELRHNIRPFDSLIRYDGDEFLIAMPSCTEKQVVACAERLKSCIHHVCFGQGDSSALQANAGYSYTAQFNPCIESRAALLRMADESLMRDVGKEAADAPVYGLI